MAAENGTSLQLWQLARNFWGGTEEARVLRGMQLNLAGAIDSAGLYRAGMRHRRERDSSHRFNGRARTQSERNIDCVGMGFRGTANWPPTVKHCQRGPFGGPVSTPATASLLRRLINRYEK